MCDCEQEFMDDLTAYRDLTMRVEAIDAAAAHYMRHHGADHPSFCHSGNLSEVFVWKETPQGVDYWLDIHYKLQEQFLC